MIIGQNRILAGLVPEYIPSEAGIVQYVGDTILCLPSEEEVAKEYTNSVISLRIFILIRVKL